MRSLEAGAQADTELQNFPLSPEPTRRPETALTRMADAACDRTPPHFSVMVVLP